jgi:hypothetical protein
MQSRIVSPGCGDGSFRTREKERRISMRRSGDILGWCVKGIVLQSAESNVEGRFCQME